MQGENVRSMPAEHALSKVEDRTTTRTVDRRPYAQTQPRTRPSSISYFHLNAIHLDHPSCMAGSLGVFTDGLMKEGKGLILVTWMFGRRTK